MKVRKWIKRVTVSTKFNVYYNGDFIFQGFTAQVNEKYGDYHVKRVTCHYLKPRNDPNDFLTEDFKGVIWLEIGKGKGKAD